MNRIHPTVTHQIRTVPSLLTYCGGVAMETGETIVWGILWPSRGPQLFLVRPAGVRHSSSEDRKLGKGLDMDESLGDQKKVQ